MLMNQLIILKAGNWRERIKHSSCFSYMNSTIVAEGKFLLTEVFQLTEEEGKRKLEQDITILQFTHHWINGARHWLPAAANITERGAARQHVLPDRRYAANYEAVVPKTIKPESIKPPESTANLQETQKSKLPLTMGMQLVKDRLWEIFQQEQPSFSNK